MTTWPSILLIKAQYMCRPFLFLQWWHQRQNSLIWEKQLGLNISSKVCKAFFRRTAKFALKRLCTRVVINKMLTMRVFTHTRYLRKLLFIFYIVIIKINLIARHVRLATDNVSDRVQWGLTSGFFCLQWNFFYSPYHLLKFSRNSLIVCSLYYYYGYY